MQEPYHPSPAYRREFQRHWMAERRAAWFAGKCCVACGSSERLELDHIFPATKVTHAVWSWSEARRAEELAKCQPLCHECHKSKTIGEMRARRAARTHCRNGHAYTAENTYRDRSGHRNCRTCRRAHH